MIILDHLLEIEREEDKKKKEAYAVGLYLSNNIFAKYVDLCYSNKWMSRYKGKEIPDVKCDNVPYGYHLSQLEREFKPFRSVAFIHVDDDNPIDEKISRRRLIQILESVSDVEQKFLKHVLSKNIPYLPESVWLEFKNL